MHRRYRSLLASVAFIGLAVPAGAQGLGMGVGTQDVVVRAGGGAGIYPGSVNPFTSWWGFRAYSPAQMTGLVNAMKLRRASDSLELDIKITTTGDFDLTAANNHCAATTCFASVKYDQTGNNACGGSCNVVNTTPANQPQIIFNCNGTKPCLQSTNAATMQLSSAATYTPATGVSTVYAVANRSTGTGIAMIAGALTGNRINAQAANTWRLTGGVSGTIDRAASDASWHVGIGVVTGTAASSLRIDDTATAGTVTGGTTATFMRLGASAAATTVRFVEGGIIDNVALSAAQQQLIVNGVRTYGYIP